MGFVMLGAAAVGLATGIVLSIDDTVKVLDALQGFVWPVVALWLLWRLLPVIARVLESRQFDVEVAGVKISVQEALEQIPRQIADLQEQVVQAAAPEHAAVERVAADERPGAKRVLWVDDRPTANVFEMQTLQDDGWTIERATSTAEASRVAAGGWDRFAVVISDMGRLEEDGYVPRAGIALAELLQAEAPQVPLAIYTNAKGRKLAPEALQAGAQLVTSSPSALLRFVGGVRT